MPFYNSRDKLLSNFDLSSDIFMLTLFLYTVVLWIYPILREVISIAHLPEGGMLVLPPPPGHSTFRVECSL